MAKKTETKAPKTTKPVGKPKLGVPKGSPPARKPAAKKPSPAVKDKKPPAEPPLLKADHRMTEKKLATLRRKPDLPVKFLLRYPLSFFLDAEDNLAQIEEDVALRACPPGYVASDMELFPEDCNAKKKEIDLLVVTVIEKAPPPEAEPAPNDVPHGSGYGGVPTGEEHRAAEFRDTSAEEGKEAGEQASKYAADSLAKQKAGESKAEYVPVAATVHSDDKEVDAKFDASPWFEQATEDNILDLARDQYKHEASSDVIAEFMADRDPKVKDVMNYVAERNVRLREAGDEAEGFGCVVDEDQALEWVEKNRPYLLPKLAEIKEGLEAEAAEARKPEPVA